MWEFLQVIVRKIYIILRADVSKDSLKIILGRSFSTRFTKRHIYIEKYNIQCVFTATYRYRVISSQAIYLQHVIENETRYLPVSHLPVRYTIVLFESHCNRYCICRRLWRSCRLPIERNASECQPFATMNDCR